MSNADTTLIVAWRTGPSVAAGPIDISGDVAAEFAALVEAAEEEFSAAGTIPAYEPDTEYEEARTLVVAQLADAVDAELIDVLRVAHVNASVTEDDVTVRKPHLYSVGVHRGNETWQFVRATSPVKFPGKTIRGRLTDSFDRLTEPILVFDDYFDFVIRSSDILVLNPTQFERITNSPSAAAAASTRLSESLVASLPLSPSGIEALTSHLASNSFSRRKAVSILRKAYLADLSVGVLTEALEKHDLDAAGYVSGGEILFTPDNVKTLLSVLNEDVFSGDFSGTEYAASRKSVL